MVNQHMAHDPTFTRTFKMAISCDTALGCALTFERDINNVWNFRGKQAMVELSANGLSEDQAELVEAHKKVLMNLENTFQANPAISPDISAADWATTARTVARMCVVQSRAYYVNDALQKRMAEAARLRKEEEDRNRPEP